MTLALTLTETKICTKCKLLKPIVEFSKRKEKVDSWCKECNRLNSYLWRHTDKGREWQRNHEKTESRQNWLQIYNQREPYKERHRKRMIIYRQTEEGKLYQEFYRQTDTYKNAQLNYVSSGKRLIQRRAYLQSIEGIIYKARMRTKRRERMQTDHPITATDWLNILSEHDYCCHYCGTQTTLTMDHVIPLSKGGKHIKENIVPACLPCNLKKGTKLLDEFTAINPVRQLIVK
jgi:5-methylcytosine-specific restriction endonuclease McrA